MGKTFWQYLCDTYAQHWVLSLDGLPPHVSNRYIYFHFFYLLIMRIAQNVKILFNKKKKIFYSNNLTTIKKHLTIMYEYIEICLEIFIIKWIIF